MIGRLNLFVLVIVAMCLAACGKPIDPASSRIAHEEAKAWLWDAGWVPGPIKGELTSKGRAAVLIIYISDPAFKDLRSLADFPNLEVVSLHRCSGVMDLTPLQKLPKLAEVLLYNCDGVSDLRPLTKLRKLECLVLKDCPGVKEVPPALVEKLNCKFHRAYRMSHPSFAK